MVSLVRQYAAWRHKVVPSRAAAWSDIRAVAVFLRWMVRHGMIQGPLPEEIKCRAEYGEPKALTLEQIEKAIAYLPPETATLGRFLLDTGLRFSEALSLTPESLDVETGTVFVRGKGGKVRRVGMGETVSAEIRALISKTPPRGRVFAGKYWTYSHRFYDAGKRAGIPFSPHRLRHSFARQFLLDGGNVGTLQRILGHSTAMMSLHYSRMYSRDATDQQRRLSPVDKMRREKNGKGDGK